jgi:hypothetical protein
MAAACDVAAIVIFTLHHFGVNRGIPPYACFVFRLTEAP